MPRIGVVIVNDIDILEEFKDIVDESRQEDNYEYYIKLRNVLDLVSNLIEENKELKEENKKLNIIRLEMLLSQFPDTTETYKKYKKELQSLLGKE